jgi:hypothetical protein
MNEFEKQDTQFEREWHEYLKYLTEWTLTHSGVEYYGMSPACFDEWRDYEAEED